MCLNALSSKSLFFFFLIFSFLSCNHLLILTSFFPSPSIFYLFISVSICSFQHPPCLQFPLTFPHPAFFILATFFQSSCSFADIFNMCSCFATDRHRHPDSDHRLIGMRHTGPSKLPWLALTANMSHEIDLGCMCMSVCVSPCVSVCVCTSTCVEQREKKGGCYCEENRTRKRAWQRFRERMKMWGQHGDGGFLSP